MIPNDDQHDTVHAWALKFYLMAPQIGSVLGNREYYIVMCLPFKFLQYISHVNYYIIH